MLSAEIWKSFDKILCIRLDNLGDVLMTTPAFRAIKESHPNVTLTLLTSRVGSLIAKSIPEIDHILIFDTPWVKNNADTSVSEINKIIDETRCHNFDAAIIFTVYSQSPLPAAMLCYQAGINNVAGYCRENPYHLISNWVPDEEPFYKIKHEVDRQLDLVKELGFTTSEDHLSIAIQREDYESLNNKMSSLGIYDIDNYLIIHPGASESKRQFSLEILKEAVQEIIKETKMKVFLTGVSSESSLCEFIRSGVEGNIYNLAGLLEMEQLIALVKNSKLVVANNTGPVHIAAAVGTPVVVLYALTNPQHTPWMVPHIVLTFDVPKESRSNNVVIKYAYEKAFKNNKNSVDATQITEAVIKLLSRQKNEYRDSKVLQL